MRNRLVVLSDLWGQLNNKWVDEYVNTLGEIFDVHYYDIRELGEINLSLTTQVEIHQQFLNGGIQSAVKNLIRMETASCTVLAFSMGGTIAWQAANAGLNAKQLHLVSATRIRKEETKPNVKMYLYFGQEDRYAPNAKWIEKHGFNKCFFHFDHAHHEFYKTQIHQQIICKTIQEVQ